MIRTAVLNVKLFRPGETEPRLVGTFPFDVLNDDDKFHLFEIESTINANPKCGRAHFEVVERFTEEATDARLDQRANVANKLSAWIARQTTIPTHSEFFDVHIANQLLHDLIVENDAMLRALRSLVSGVEDIAAYWPDEDLPKGHPLNDLIGFLFATLPLAQRAAK